MSLVEDLIKEAVIDEVGLWLVIAKLRNDLQVPDSKRLRAAVLDCVRNLLESGEVVAGYYKPDGKGIEVWDIPIADILARIDDEWDKLGREPNIGEIAVFVGRPQA